MLSQTFCIVLFTLLVTCLTIVQSQPFYCSSVPKYAKACNTTDCSSKVTGSTCCLITSPAIICYCNNSTVCSTSNTTSSVNTDSTTTVQPTTVQPTTVQLTKVQPAKVQPTTVQLNTVQSTIIKLTTVQPTTVQPTTVQPTTVQPNTVQPNTVQSTVTKLTTVQPTTLQPNTVQSTIIKLTTVQPTTVQPTTVQPFTPVNNSFFYELPNCCSGDFSSTMPQLCDNLETCFNSTTRNDCCLQFRRIVDGLYVPACHCAGKVKCLPLAR